MQFYLKELNLYILLLYLPEYEVLFISRKELISNIQVSGVILCHVVFSISSRVYPNFLFRLF